MNQNIFELSIPVLNLKTSPPILSSGETSLFIVLI